MLSLQDELQKFERLTYNPELKAFIPIEQMFMSNSITVASLVKENNFILEEFKKMSGLFRNFCKLNSKVYSQILEREMIIRDEQLKIQGVAKAVERKCQQNLVITKEIHEDIIVKATKNEHIVNDALTQVSDKIVNKLQRSEFTEYMKKMMEDQIVDKIEPCQEEIKTQKMQYNDVQSTSQVGETVNPIEVIPQKKKVKSLSIEQFGQFKLQLETQLSAYENSLAAQSITITLQQKQIDRGVDRNRELELIIQENTKQIQKCKDSLAMVAGTTKNELQTISQQLVEKTNPSILFHKMEEFYLQRISPNINSLHVQIESQGKQASLRAADIQKQFTKQQTALKSHESQIEDLQHKLAGMEANLLQTNDSLVKGLAKCSIELKQQQKAITRTHIDMANERNATYQENQLKIQALHKIIQGLSQNTTETVLKAVSKKIEAQLKLLENQQRRCGQIQDDLNSKFNGIHTEITNICDMVAKKANFTDLLLHSDKKVDREDFKKFKSDFLRPIDKGEFFQTEQCIRKESKESKDLDPSRQNKSYLGTRNSVTSRRRTALSRTSKTLLMDVLEKQGEQGAKLRLFMCGLDQGMMDLNSTQTSTRRKTLRPTTAGRT